MRYRCRTCGGVYQDPQPDGLAYYHACPPLLNPLYYPHFDGARPFDPHEVVERIDKRDENVLASGEPNSGETRIKREGKGRDPLS